MLDKKDIVEKLKTLKLPAGEYCIMTGAALVLQGVKEATQDIDIGCGEEFFRALQQRGYKALVKNGDAYIIIDDCIEVFLNWLPEKSSFVEGLPVADIMCTRAYKQKKGREKDLKDILLIDEYLKKNQQYKG